MAKATQTQELFARVLTCYLPVSIVPAHDVTERYSNSRETPKGSVSSVLCRVGHKTNNHLTEKDFRMSSQRIQGLSGLRLLSIALPLALAACSVGEAGNPPSAPPAPEVTTAEVAVQDLNDWADFTGRLEAVESVEIRPRVGGYVESVHFAEGGRVAAGDLLYQIDPRPFKAEVARLKAEQVRAQAQLKLADSYRVRAERLLEQKATSQEEAERNAADASVAAAQLASISAALENAELNLSFTRVTAPIAGRVSRAIVTAGNLVDASVVLTTVVSDESVYAYFDVDEQTYLEHVQQSNAAEHSVVHVGLINEIGRASCREEVERS